MNPLYLQTHFKVEAEAALTHWPTEFAIITAYATTGESWPPAENEAADQRLEHQLRARGGFLRRITGYSPDTGHAEPGWATDMNWQEAADVGEAFKQDAIYVVSNNDLWVTYCDAPHRDLVHVSTFQDRLTLP